MKTLSLTFGALLFFSQIQPAHAAKKQKISDYEKGRICQAVMNKYPDDIDGESEDEQMATCLNEGHFTKDGNSYTVETAAINGTISCDASMKDGENHSHASKVELSNCDLK